MPITSTACRADGSGNYGWSVTQSLIQLPLVSEIAEPYHSNFQQGLATSYCGGAGEETPLDNWAV